MNENISCSVIRDLLPNYIDKLTSKETNEVMEKHFETCQSCSRDRDEMMAQTETQTETQTVSQNQNFRKYLNKTKTMYLLKGTLLSIGIIGILVCFIVDLAVNHKLSWSLLVDMSIVFCYGIGLAAMYAEKKKTLMAFLTGSILILPMLYGFEYIINLDLLAQPVRWFGKYAFPITIIWLVILWITLFLFQAAKMNIWNTMGVLSLMTIPGAALTNAIARQVSVSQVYQSGEEWINSLSFAAAAVLLFCIGKIRKNRQK